jgi:uncharacterized membrane protein
MTEPGRRRTSLFLTISLIVNVFLIGLIVGVFASDPPSFRSRRSVVPDFLAVPEPSRTQARDALAARSGELRERGGALRRAQRQAMRTIGRDPLDPAAAEAAFRDLRDRTQAMQTVVHEALLNAARTMPAGDRERLFRYLLLVPRGEMPLAGTVPPHGLGRGA